ncbi:50S ribosomal protein L9 [Clostridium sp. CAG:448]|nr:50S ribosomal protein L9 [Clostridium sp. CAG:448]
MKVLLLKDVKSQGKQGEIIDVSDGYAVNFLIPKKLAVRANNAIMSEVRSKEEARLHKIETEKAEARVLAAKLESTIVKLHAASGSDDKLYGSITNKDVAETLEKDYGIVIDKRRITLNEPIRSYGTYTLDVKLYPEISGTIHLVVTK